MLPLFRVAARRATPLSTPRRQAVYLSHPLCPHTVSLSLSLSLKTGSSTLRLPRSSSSYSSEHLTFRLRRDYRLDWLAAVSVIYAVQKFAGVVSHPTRSPRYPPRLPASAFPSLCSTSSWEGTGHQAEPPLRRRGRVEGTRSKLTVLLNISRAVTCRCEESEAHYRPDQAVRVM
jgi:hypothetical protein